MPPIIHFLGTDTTDNTATFAINGQRWEYWLPNPATVESVNYIASHWIKRGLAFAKKHAIRAERR